MDKPQVWCQSSGGRVLWKEPSKINGFLRFYKEHKGHRIWWGDWYRVMKRRRDPKSLVHKCKQCGTQLHILPHPEV